MRTGLVAFIVAVVLIPSLACAAGNADKGKGLYGDQCASCHGAGGKGDGAAGAALDPKPRDLTDKQYMSKLTDQRLTDVIKKGGPAVGKSAAMAAFGDSMSDADIADVVAYVRSLAK